MAQQTGIVIVGGGIWGLSTAYHLAKLGQKHVRVLERNCELAAETTPQAAGLVGQIRSSATMLRAIQYALELFSRFPEETGYDTGLRQTGSLMVALTPARMEAYARQVERSRQNGIKAEFVSHAEMARLAPALDVSKVEGGYFVPDDGYVQPQQCANAYAAAARDLGVQIQLETHVTGLRLHNDQVLGVETERGFIESNQVVFTAGPWSGILSRKTGFTAAMQPIRHQRACTVPVSGIPEHHPVVRVTDVSCYLRPEKGGYLYGFFEPNPVSIDLDTMPADYRTQDIEPPVAVMTEAQRRLTPIFPILKDLEIAEYRQGMTTFAPDGSYLIGPAPGVDGLFLATGCAALGIAGSAAVGRWLAKWMLEGNPGEDLSDFAPERFGDRAADGAWLRREAEQFYANYYSIRPAE
ncbi:MAG: FAD-binding oxidoreductase [Candidatus Poribacteria bacterium]|nr:FAD-binding oxidoreductase [Candidatus Poribacteria bacterium]